MRRRPTKNRPTPGRGLVGSSAGGSVAHALALLSLYDDDSEQLGWETEGLRDRRSRCGGGSVPRLVGPVAVGDPAAPDRGGA
uniref:hypothetical protein n=1 Tax=Ornithinimicrobium ciconiae TaxID=2594265 RepID=UPI0038994EB9